MKSVFISFSGSVPRFKSIVILRPDLSVSSLMSLMSRSLPVLLSSIIFSIIASLVVVGGISVIFQVLSTAKSIRPPIWLIVLSRFAHGIISALLTVFAENLWPRSLSTGFYNVQPQGPIFYQTPLAGLSLIFLFVVLVAFCRKTKSSSPNHNLISINPR